MAEIQRALKRDVACPSFHRIWYVSSFPVAYKREPTLVICAEDSARDGRAEDRIG
jgi:hypothetical protein